MPQRTATPGVSPGGRGVNPLTGQVGDMPGGMDYLAGLGPAPAGVNIPDQAPIIQTAKLGVSMPGPNSPLFGMANPWLQAARSGVFNKSPANVPTQGGAGGLLNTPSPMSNPSAPINSLSPGGRIIPNQPAQNPAMQIAQMLSNLGRFAPMYQLGRFSTGRY